MKYPEVYCNRNQTEPKWFLSKTNEQLPKCIYNDEQCPIDQLLTLSNGGYTSITNKGKQAARIHCNGDFVLSFEDKPMYLMQMKEMVNFE